MLTEHILRRLSVGMCLKHFSFIIISSQFISSIIYVYLSWRTNFNLILEYWGHTEEVQASDVE